MNPIDLPTLQQCFLQSSFCGHGSHSQAPNDSSDDCIQMLQAWQNPVSDARPAGLMGWDAFYRKDWVKSLHLFESALKHHQWHPLVALGIGRLATRFGSWNIACDWLLYGLTCARNQYNDDLLMQYHGAMGELLIRTGHPQEAFQQMQLSYALTPAGHPSRQLQYNFIAMSLARLGKSSVAETYYMNASFLAKSPLDKMHALVRRAALSLNDYAVDLDQIGSELKQLVDAIPSNRAKVKLPMDYFSIISYWNEWKNKKPVNPPMIMHLFEGYPLESRVIAALTGLDSNCPEMCFPLVPTMSPDPLEIRQLSWDATIATHIGSAETLRSQLKLFFI